MAWYGRACSAPLMFERSDEHLPRHNATFEDR
ncbi:MAG: hypothetical protein JWM54_1864, partial [Acidobacteriaceae bacterium]|nr:hypothetical protein [Acidobacteriaceae bacterium]